MTFDHISEMESLLCLPFQVRLHRTILVCTTCTVQLYQLKKSIPNFTNTWSSAEVLAGKGEKSLFLLWRLKLRLNILGCTAEDMAR